MNHVERAWWIFRLPEAIATVPADTEEQARVKLAATCYKGAPVHEWPCVGSRWASREAVGR